MMERYWVVSEGSVDIFVDFDLALAKVATHRVFCRNARLLEEIEGGELEDITP